MSVSTIIISVILLGAFALALRSIIRNIKNKKCPGCAGGCHGSCSGCAAEGK